MGVFNLFKKKKEEDNKPTSRFIDDEWLEVTASSKDEAIERACMALNTNASHLEVKVLSKDGKKIQARKTDGKTSEKTDETSAQPRQARGRGGRDGNRDGNRGGNRGNSRGGQQRNNRNDRNDRGNARRPVRDEQTDEEMQMSDDDYNNQRNYQDEDRQDYHDQEASSDRGNSRRYEEPEEDFVEEVEEETDLGRKAKEILVQIIQKIEPNAKVELFETNKTIRLEIISDESGLFIGKFGQTLDSIQHILKKILEIKFEDGKNLVVDAEDYRVRREEAIESKARKLAKKARQEGRPVSVEPMNAMDRRIVHMALKGEPGIETKSVGEGSSRRVLIVPKRRSQGRNGGRDGGRGRGPSRGGRDGGRNFRGRGDDRQGGRGRDGNSRMHDSYDVPSLPKSDVYGDNPEEYFENYDDEK